MSLRHERGSWFGFSSQLAGAAVRAHVAPAGKTVQAFKPDPRARFKARVAKFPTRSWKPRSGDAPISTSQRQLARDEPVKRSDSEQ